MGFIKVALTMKSRLQSQLKRSYQFWQLTSSTYFHTALVLGRRNANSLSA